MADEIQNNEMYLAGGFGDMIIASTGQKSKITSIASALGSNCVTITVSRSHLTTQNTEDADFEIIEPLQLPNSEPISEPLPKKEK